MATELWRAVPEGAHEILPDKRCPRCGEQRTHRSRIRGFLEQTMRMLTPLRPFSCSSCHWRGWRVPIASMGQAVPLPPMPQNRRRTSRADRRHAEHMSSGEILRRRQRVQAVMASGIAVFVMLFIVRCFGGSGPGGG